ncbi:ABC transporter permease [Azospirillum sp. ST 5-10]|uniref:ABC transporter permease n=1 Tax=unclassified Azospirillum TaxID=2630922 RepID=UPI003F4A1324
MMSSLAHRLAPVVTLIGAVLAWEAVCRLLAIPHFILPPPSAIVEAGVAISLADWGLNIGATLTIVLAGFFISLAISLPLAILLVDSPLLSRSVVPLLVIVQSTPVAAVAPIIIVALGAGNLSRLVITVLITFFPLVVATAAGLRATPPELLELSNSLNAGKRRQYLQIRLPYAVPFIFSAMRVSVTLAMVGAVIAEFVASEHGLGYLLINATALFKVSQAFAALIMLVAISLALYYAVTLIERVLFPWSVSKPGG